MPPIHVRFRRFTSLNTTIRLREGEIHASLSDLLEGAPESVLHAIAHILLAKLYRKPIDAAHNLRYKRFASSAAVTRQTELIRTRAAASATSAPRAATFTSKRSSTRSTRASSAGCSAAPTSPGASTTPSARSATTTPPTTPSSSAASSTGPPALATPSSTCSTTRCSTSSTPSRARGLRRCVHPPRIQGRRSALPATRRGPRLHQAPVASFSGPSVEGARVRPPFRASLSTKKTFPCSLALFPNPYSLPSMFPSNSPPSPHRGSCTTIPAPSPAAPSHADRHSSPCPPAPPSPQRA